MSTRRDVLTSAVAAGVARDPFNAQMFTTPSRGNVGAGSSAMAASNPFRVISFSILEQQAKALLPPEAYMFLADGAGDQWTLAQNTRIFTDYPIEPRQFTGLRTNEIDLTSSLLGTKLPFPIVAAPVGVQRFFHPSGEIGAAAGTSQAGTLYTASSASNFPMEEIAKASRGSPQWFQLYFNNDLAVTSELLKRAKAAGFAAIVVTIDALGPGTSDAFSEMGSPFPKSLTFANNDPKFGGRGNFADQKTDFRPSDIEWVRKQVELPVIVKGILNPQNAVDAVAAGAAAVQVSNHGGRQFDGLPAALAALPGVAKALGGKVPVVFDSGIRRGADVFRALALGADAVALGRPLMYALTVAGADGVRAAFQHVADELRLAMLFAGVRRISEINQSQLHLGA